ncbi:hypothetical protein DsansV1_C18g0154561 [Dioscorea sansibarensis]
MASLHLSSPVLKNHVLQRSPNHNSRFSSHRMITFPKKSTKNLSLCCTAALPLESTSPLLPKFKWRKNVEPFPIDASEDGAAATTTTTTTTKTKTKDKATTPAPKDQAPTLSQEQDAIQELPKSKQEAEEEEPFRLLKWPMRLIVPSVLLMTAMAPTLWLPLPAVFEVVDLSGFLSLVGLDCTFNIGATLFFLVSDAYGRPKRSLKAIESQIPLSNKLWNMVANAAGFAFPLIMLMASSTYIVRPPLPFISFSVMLGPYLLMLAVQIVAEVLTWRWKSPAWLLVPVVYEVYRMFQLRRAVRLAVLLGAPAWSVEGLLVLISGWVLILVVQLLRVAWFSGYAARSQRRLPV